ncbi:MAG: M48 family metallopeptidase [Candidatus Omnitrophica bacterium]|nr:M48 family metallopeptidase [Candidatus Omnitrophota bacterium]MDD5660836.1 M48 family metallopeptidase [Candidatus Omnitrophota bacterium]
MANSAKSYSHWKYTLSIIDTVYSIALILIFLGSGLSLSLEVFLKSLGINGYFLTAVFLLAVFLLYYLFNLPFSLYSGFILEHRFNLTKQRIGDWWLDQLKSSVLGYVFSLILILTFYWVLSKFSQWWFMISVFWIIFSIILAKLTPVFIIPLFFKYKQLEDQLLRQRIFGLAQKMQINILDVFEIDFSKKTLKANAAFTGMGKTKRVILADTLKDKYTNDEVEVILAHEFAHYQLRHIIKLIAINSLITLGLFYLIFKTNSYFLEVFKLDSLAQLAGLPLVFLYFIVFGIVTRPLEAFISRSFEKEADNLALKVTNSKEAFISLMEKLAGQNLADRSPHPLIKLFFFDHPPIDERIALAREYLSS